MIKTGISTASLFLRDVTEDAVEFLSKSGVKTAEVFLSTYQGYTAAFGEIVNAKKGDMEINSVHVLNTQYEPQLYSLNPRAKEDAFSILGNSMAAAKAFGAKYYTFHGMARVKRTPMVIDYDFVGKCTQEIIDKCAGYGVTLAYENVHWAYYNYIGFFSEIKKRTTGLKGTLDVKQARQSGIPCKDFIDEMKGDIVTVHLSDIDKDGKMCLPGKGTTDFYDLFCRLRDVGFDGAFLIEVYKNDYGDKRELLDSLDYIGELKDKIF